MFAIARRLHDGACLHGDDCGLRDFHAMDIYETDVRAMLTAMVQASAEADSLEISSAAAEVNAGGCTASGRALHAVAPQYGGGIRWVHTR